MKTYIIIFIFSAILGSILMFSFTKLTKQKSTQTSFNPEKAPTESLQGKIATFSGIIKWQSRIATEAAEVDSLKEIQQGEQIETEISSNLIVEFPNIWRINILSNSKLEFAQTLPANLVISQKEGSAEYQKLGENVLSVRALHLLINQNQGDMVVIVDKDNNNVFINVKTGFVTAAYNDDENISRVVQVKTGQRLNFDDETREAVVR